MTMPADPMPADDDARRRLIADLGEAASRPGDPLRRAFELLATAAAADPPKYPVPVLTAVADLLRQTAEEVGDSPSAAQVAEAASAVARYAQPNWQVEKVFNVLVSNTEAARPAAEPRRLPFVLAVMNRAEAADLVEGRAFDGCPAPLTEAFGALRDMLDAAVVGDWADRYDDERERWRPFGAGHGTLAELVGATVARLNDRYRYQPPVAADFRAVTELSRDRWELRRLRHEGCILIVDAISMRHPLLQRALHASLLDAYPTTSVMLVAPAATALEARELAVILELRLADLEFNQRRMDPDEEFGASWEAVEQPVLEKWLTNRVQVMAGSHGVRSGIRSFMSYGRGGDS
jgi:hypothetical protein